MSDTNALFDSLLAAYRNADDPDRFLREFLLRLDDATTNAVVAAERKLERLDAAKARLDAAREIARPDAALDADDDEPQDEEQDQPQDEEQDEPRAEEEEEPQAEEQDEEPRPKPKKAKTKRRVAASDSA